MKKSALLLLSASLLTLVACGDNGNDDALKIALVTDSGTLNDHNFNQTSWEAVNDWAVANGGGTVKNNIVSNGSIHTMYYQPTSSSAEFTTAERVAAVEAAVEWGAKFVVLPGYLFQPVVKQVQGRYKDVCFLALDCVNQDSDNDYTEYKLEANVSMTQYQEEQAGFLAGYGAVKDGLTKLGFIGGMAVPAVQRYGYGYVQGAEKAATELGLADGSVKMDYYYAGAFASTTEATEFATSWYNNGTETIFACGGAVYNSVTTGLSQATNKDGKSWIGVDTNQHADTSIQPAGTREKLLTSAMKGLGTSIKEALTSWKDNENKFDAKHSAKIQTLGINQDAVALPTEATTGDKGCWGFKKWTEADYAKLVADMKAGTVTVSNDTSKAPTTVKVSATYHNK
ncbi:MAG: BMP family ABC transporter substrate-binding protein [Mollicutes bacterium]|nr:BMP family ABC transporter substrate-binding protein [Mollicutes bacterium]MDY4936182.1 BMP family ABC transporter substrate-binding protein [Candidatus Enteromonas sp.]